MRFLNYWAMAMSLLLLLPLASANSASALDAARGIDVRAKREKTTEKAITTYSVFIIRINEDNRIGELKTFEEIKIPEEMVFIEGSCFDMGDTFGDGDSDEKPVHDVCCR